MKESHTITDKEVKADFPEGTFVKFVQVEDELCDITQIIAHNITTNKMVIFRDDSIYYCVGIIEGDYGESLGDADDSDKILNGDLTFCVIKAEVSYEMDSEETWTRVYMDLKVRTATDVFRYRRISNK